MNGVMVVIGTNDLDEYYEMDTVPVMGIRLSVNFWKPQVERNAGQCGRSVRWLRV